MGCGLSDYRVLQINHKNGGGSREYRALRGRIDILIDTILSGIRSSDDLELRCANCNVLFEYERGVRLGAENYGVPAA